ncbi:hypothetical protein ES703_41133 [subsurface metagenome]
MKISEAALFLGPIGEIRGGVFGRTKYAKYLRRTYRPDIPSPKQLQARTDWSTTDAAWQILTEDNKNLWRAWKSYLMNWGYNRFMKVNYPRQRSGLPLLTEPPDYPPWL